MPSAHPGSTSSCHSLQKPSHAAHTQITVVAPVGQDDDEDGSAAAVGTLDCWDVPPFLISGGKQHAMSAPEDGLGGG